MNELIKKILKKNLVGFRPLKVHPIHQRLSSSVIHGTNEMVMKIDFFLFFSKHTCRGGGVCGADKSSLAAPRPALPAPPNLWRHIITLFFLAYIYFGHGVIKMSSS